MAVQANTLETYDNGLIFEDLQNAYTMISPEVCPFQQVVSTSNDISSTYKEWPIVELDDVDGNNRVAEGDVDLPNDQPTTGLRLGNYTQISDKVISVSHTNEAIDAAADNIQRMAKQLTLKMRSMKRDKEYMFLENIAASAGATDVPRVMAGLPAFIRTNTEFGVGGADPTLSGVTEGYPDAAATAGTAAAVSETTFKDLIQAAWTAGGSPTLALMNANNKRLITENFDGAGAVVEREQDERKLISAIDYYETDFGVLALVPHRFMPTNNPDGANDSFSIIGLDPEYVQILYLEEMQEKPLAETGHAKRRLVWCEYTLQVDNEKAHWLYRDTNGTAAAA